MVIESRPSLTRYLQDRLPDGTRLFESRVNEWNTIPSRKIKNRQTENHCIETEYLFPYLHYLSVLICIFIMKETGGPLAQTNLRRRKLRTPVPLRFQQK